MPLQRIISNHRMYGKSLCCLVLLVLMFQGQSCKRENGSRESAALTGQDLEEGFRNPPNEAGIRCWWWWLNSNVTRESITRDLEAMYDKGFSGAMIFDAGTELWWGPDNPPPVGPMFSGCA